MRWVVEAQPRVGSTRRGVLSTTSRDQSICWRSWSRVVRCCARRGSPARRRTTLSPVTVKPTALQAASKAFSPSQLAYLQVLGPEVAEAPKDDPHQWQIWWWVCAAGQLLFLPIV